MALGILGTDSSAAQPIVLSVDNAAQIRTRALLAGLVLGTIGASAYFMLKYHRAFALPQHR